MFTVVHVGWCTTGVNKLRCNTKAMYFCAPYASSQFLTCHAVVGIEVGEQEGEQGSLSYPLKPYSAVLSHTFNGRSYRPVLGAPSSLQRLA